MEEKKEYGYCTSCKAQTPQKHWSEFHQESMQTATLFECLKCHRIKKVWN